MLAQAEQVLPDVKFMYPGIVAQAVLDLSGAHDGTGRETNPQALRGGFTGRRRPAVFELVPETA